LLWFYSIEAFITTILKVLCLLSREDYQPHAKQKLLTRFKSCVTASGHDQAEVQQTGVLSRLQEFCTFRNDILHDRYLRKQRTYKHTEFSPIPYRANQLDLVQAITISIEVFYLLSRVIPGLNLIPSVPIFTDGKFGHEKLDVLYAQLVRPYFRRLLEKHRLTCSLDLDLELLVLAPSPDLRPGDVVPVVRALPTSDLPCPIVRATDLAKGLSHSLIGDPPSFEAGDTFGLPGYIDRGFPGSAQILSVSARSHESSV
jgi:hypothetical protein